MIWEALQKRCTLGTDEAGTDFFFVSVDFLINSKQCANTFMAVLIRRVTCKSLFSFWGQRKVLSCEIFLSRTSTLFPSRQSASPFLNCDQISKLSE